MKPPKMKTTKGGRKGTGLRSPFGSAVVKGGRSNGSGGRGSSRGGGRGK